MSGAEPEERVRVPMILQRWCDVVFLHWPCDQEAVGAMLPAGLSVDTFDGTAWLTLTPFAVEGSRPPIAPPLPGLSQFTETNVRTYVVGPDGRDGLWFFTLETDSVSLTAAARAALGIPYRWAAMQRQRNGEVVTYASRRRLSDDPPGHRTTVTTDRSAGLTEPRLAAWLTGRWRAWTEVAGHLLAVPVEHEPWPITDATVVAHDDTLLASLGLPQPSEPPVVHAAPAVTARLGWPTLGSPKGRTGRRMQTASTPRTEERAIGS